MKWTPSTVNHRRSLARPLLRGVLHVSGLRHLALPSRKGRDIEILARDSVMATWGVRGSCLWGHYPTLLAKIIAAPPPAGLTHD